MRKQFFSLFSVLILFALVLSACGAPAAPAAQPATEGGPVVDEGQAATVVEAGELVPPVVAEACEGEACFCQDKTVTVIVNGIWVGVR